MGLRFLVCALYSAHCLSCHPTTISSHAMGMCMRSRVKAHACRTLAVLTWLGSCFLAPPAHRPHVKTPASLNPSLLSNARARSTPRHGGAWIQGASGGGLRATSCTKDGGDTDARKGKNCEYGAALHLSRHCQQKISGGPSRKRFMIKHRIVPRTHSKPLRTRFKENTF